MKFIEFRVSLRSTLAPPGRSANDAELCVSGFALDPRFSLRSTLAPRCVTQVNLSVGFNKNFGNAVLAHCLGSAPPGRCDSIATWLSRVKRSISRKARISLQKIFRG